jgi:amidohydrolase
MSDSLNEKIISLAQSLAEKSVTLRRTLHRIPEVAWQETETSAALKRFLSKQKLDYRPVAGTGIVAEIRNGNGRCAAIRTDVDGLPITEETDLAFKSIHAGRMHACGHDLHMAIVSTAAVMLSRLKGYYCGTVKFLYQPAEEDPPGGAAEMIRAGVLENPKVEMLFGLHVSPAIPTGKIGVRDGGLFGGVVDFDVEIVGKGGHGAIPHKAIDPIVCASAVVTALQAIVSRQTDPFDPVVITVGKIEGGSARNVIPQSCRLFGTARAQSLRTLEQVKRTIDNVIKRTAQSYQCQAIIKYHEGYPPLLNDPRANEHIVRSTRELFGERAVYMIPKPSMGAEDFARYLQQVPGAMFFLGVRNKEIGATYGWHHPKFTADEAAIPFGAAVLTKAVVEFLNA